MTTTWWKRGWLAKQLFGEGEPAPEPPAVAAAPSAPEPEPARKSLPALPPEPTAVWIDVGAHFGEKTFDHAERDPALRVYAFEPILPVAARRMGQLPNYVVLPMAVAEEDGCADFHLNSFAAASSLLPFNPPGLKQWVGGEQLTVERTLCVPTIRLDTFLCLMGIARVDYLKIDAQGSDLAVIRSLGDRLADVRELSLEVQINPIPLYAGGSDKQDVIDYLLRKGFRLVATEKQSHDQEENLSFTRAA
jgi:FkbM family methyltransferase